MTDPNFDYNKLEDKEKINFIIQKQHLSIIFNEFGQGSKIIDKIKKIAPISNEFYLATKLYQYMPTSMNYDEKLEAIKANLKLRKQLKFPFIGPDYSIQFTNPKFDNSGTCYNVHVEAGMQVEIIKNIPFSKRIVTFNAFLTKEKKKRCMRINNIQGVDNSILDLNLLSNTLKENWRIKIVKIINKICEEKKIKLIGELPKKFVSGKKDSEYERILRQYIQTYLLGGIKQENLDVSKINDYKLRNKLEKTIKNKEKNKLIHEKRIENLKQKEKNSKPKPRISRKYL